MSTIRSLMVLTIGFGFGWPTADSDCVESSIPQSLLSVLDECRAQNLTEFQRIWNQCVRSAMLDYDSTKQDSTPVMSTVMACEGNSLNLACGAGTTVRIFAANYGRTEGESICPSSNIHTTDCREGNSKTVALSKCNKVSACSIPATNDVFGDPCAGTRKYLSVTFYCS